MSRLCAQIALTLLYPARWLAQVTGETSVGAPAAAISVIAGARELRETDTALS